MFLHLLKSILILGTFSSFLVFAYTWSLYGFYIDFGLLVIWGIAIAINGVFISFFCWPVLKYLVASNKVLSNVIVGAVQGIIFVSVFTFAFTQYWHPISSMLSKMWLYYVSFLLVGGAYGWFYQKHAI